MSLYRFSLFSVFAIAVTLSSIAKASDGVIHFMGAIVDDACNVTNTESSIQTRCYRNGKVLTQTAPINQTTSETALPRQIGWSKIETINDKENLKVLTITYR